ncbi:ogr/Delta-like zinc finger family protein [Comamonas fluminis]|uniref:ogr/Delta-like zinc finger family protein n=1 Tax=Comamonas fluminis TaxID=2796366 RepID=UPI001C481BA4|nr:ogr/Delta-like zinc finger family protein [Comamonas fluminis]
MSVTNPFDTEPGLAAHRSFSQAALAVGARKVSMGVPAPQSVGQTGQGCNAENADGTDLGDAAHHAERDLPRERTRLECPHCEHPCVIRTSRRMSKLTREYAYCCTNYECGHTFVASMEIQRTVSPSATPDPSVDLPLSSHVRRDLVRAQMDFARAAPHQAVLTKPVTGDLFVGQPPDPPRS